MAVLASNETYTRFVIDPDEGDTKFIVDGELVNVDDLQRVLEEKGDEARIERMVSVPKEGATKINVTFRPLRAKDKFAVQDQATEQGMIAPGSSRRMLIKRAVVAWDYPTAAWSEAILDALDPDIEEQIYSWISWGSEPPEQDQETGLQKRPLADGETTESEAKTKKPPAGSSSLKKKTDEEISLGASSDD